MAIHRIAQEVNAGSMADIAFLLLIFFLVTASIETDVGINKMLPPKNDETIAEFKERNVLKISMNNTNDLMVNGALFNVESLREKVVSFIDNGASSCDYCQGEGVDYLSENPIKAIISIKAQRNTSYPLYVSVQNEVLAAYNDLRNRESLRLFNVSFQDMEKKYQMQSTNEGTKRKLKEQIERIRERYPQSIWEPVTIND
jgi:hypothetical protein